MSSTASMALASAFGLEFRLQPVGPWQVHWRWDLSAAGLAEADA